MQLALHFDSVVNKGSAIFQQLVAEDQLLLIRGNAFLVLDLGLHIVDGVGWLDLKSDGLTSESFDENLHFGCGVVVCFYYYKI